MVVEVDNRAAVVTDIGAAVAVVDLAIMDLVAVVVDNTET